MLNNGRYLRIGIGTLFALLIIGYAGSKSINLIAGPTLTLERPVDGETVHSPYLEIAGNAKNIAFLTLNDRQIFVDDAGTISDVLLLSEGHSIVTLKARDRFGRERSETRHIIYNP